MNPDFDPALPDPQPEPEPGTVPLPVTVSSSPVHLPIPPVTGANVFDEVPGTGPTSPAHVQFDLTGLAAAGAEPETWATALAQQIGQVTGVWFAIDSFAEVFEQYQVQAVRAEAREIAFLVANLSIPSKVEGDPAGQLLRLRSDITAGLTKRAGI